MQLETDIRKREQLPGGFCFWGKEASVTAQKVQLLGSAEESLHRTHYHDIPLLPSASQRILFVLLLQQ